MSEKNFYDNLWIMKKKGEKKPRDFFHRYFLDYVIDYAANDRIEVAAKMLTGGQRVLDLGIWGGTFLNLPDIKNKYSDRFGLDISRESVIAAKESGITNAQEWNLNAFPYPFKDSYFDSVSLLAVVEHLFDPDEVIIEAYRLLKPGGQIVLALPNVASLSNRMRLFLGKLPITSDDPGWDGGHLHYFTISEAKKLLLRNKFKITGLGISGGNQKIRMIWPSMLAGEFILCGEKI